MVVGFSALQSAWPAVASSSNLNPSSWWTMGSVRSLLKQKTPEDSIGKVGAFDRC